MGRPTVYTREIADEVCRRIAGGQTLSEVCRDENMPPRTTVAQWDIDNRDEFSVRYARARCHLLEHWADEVTTIADDGTNDWIERNAPDNEGWQFNGEHVQRSRLRTDNRKWLLSKLRPDKYGDKLDLNNTHGVTDRLAALMEKIGQNGRKIYDKKPEDE